MTAQAFDAISRDLGVRSARRHVLRLLGRRAALGVVAMVGLDQVEATKACGGNGTRKKRCPLEARCVKGTCVLKRRFRATCTVEGVEVAIGALVRDLPPEHRVEAIGRVVDALRRLYAAEGAPEPPWLAQLAEAWPGGPPEP